jgi:GntR family transcriptional regulator of arabinose operon
MPPAQRLFRYQEIAMEIRRRILRGDFREGGRLPSERALVQSFGVQRNTIRQALTLLEEEGHISIEDKRGAFVRLARPDSGRTVFLLNIHAGSSPNLSRMTEGFSDVAARAGYSLRRFNTHPPEGAALDPLPDADKLADDIAGVMLWPQNPTNPEAVIRLNARIPLVLVDRRVLGAAVDCVRFDDVAGGKAVAEHLLEQGHRRIAFLTDDVFAETVQHRWHGYALAHEAWSVPIDPRLSVFCHGFHEPFFSTTLRLLLGLGRESPTAIICSNDLVAFMLLRFLRDEGVRVPDDVAVTGYGNTMPDYAEAMALTSVDQPFYEMGQTAATMLLERVGQAFEDRLRDVRDVTIPVRLIERQSSSPRRRVEIAEAVAVP